jgi:phosphatidate cytidylyltransferase
MKQRLIVSGIGVPLVLIVLLVLPAYATAIYTAVICAIGVHEMLNAAGAGKRTLAVILCILSSIAVQAAALFLNYTSAVIILLPFGLLLFLLWVAYYEKGRDLGFTGFGACLFSGFFVPMGLAAMIILRKGDDGRLMVMLPVIATFIGDSGAYFAGRALGTKKMSPKTSPNKTVAGLIGGLAASAIFMTLYGFIMKRFGVDIPFWKLFVTGLIGGAAAQLGDLSFSIIKRHFNIKDYGKFLPGHGGAYDRFDSTTFASPTILAVLFILGAL